MERVGLPKASQMISVSASVRAPSATSQIMSGMAEASSIMRRMRLPLLCRPANASVFFSDQVIWSMRHVRSRDGSLDRSAVAVRVKCSRAMNWLYHRPSSDHVLVLSWVSVLAVITPRVSGAVVKAQRMTHATRADLPMPWPEARAI